VQRGQIGRPLSASKIRHVHVIVLLALAAGCWRIGEPTTGDAVVAWAAFPDTVAAGEKFPLEFAGPIASNACGRLDTAIALVIDTTIELSARRTTYRTMCSDLPISFYEVRSMELPAGSYAIRTAEGRLGRIVAVEGGQFTPMRAAGTGTIRGIGGCVLFGPGQLGGNQRPFSLTGRAVTEAALAPALGTRRLVHVRGTLSGFTLCGSFGSRPAILVSEIRVLDRTVRDYYEE
jgi:hypothetical protein